MRFLLVGDVHLADRPPSVRTESYTDDILAKVRWCSEYANEHDLDAVIYLGDVFHLKAPSRNSHNLVLRTAEAMQVFRGTSWIVPGNHDIQQDRLDSLDSQPLGALALAPRIALADGYIPELDVVSIPYLDDLEEFTRRCAAYSGDIDIAPPSLLVTHQSIFPPGENPPYPHLNADELAANWGTTPMAYGHIHDPHGFYQANGVWFCNMGAISRGSLHEETLRRTPRVTVFDSNTRDCPFTAVNVPHKPAEEVFRLAEVAEQREKIERLDDFLDKVGTVTLTSLSIEAIIADAERHLDRQAMAELHEIIEAAR